MEYHSPVFSPSLKFQTHTSPIFSVFPEDFGFIMPKRRKTGLTRMDAALDQVSCLGFSRPLIRKTVRNLLKVYGEDGWKLIEEDCYKVVLDVILDEQDTEQTQDLLTDDASLQQENTGIELAIPEFNEVVTEDASFEGSNNASLTINTGIENDECCVDINMDKTANSSTFPDESPKDQINIQSSENTPVTIPSPDVGHTPVNVPVCTRKPCYGWICDDDDDDDEETYFIRLTPAR